MSVNTFTVQVTDRNYNLLGAIPCTGLKFSSVLNGYGAISFTVNPDVYDALGNQTPTKKQLDTWTTPWKTYFFVDYNGRCVWAGPCTSKDRQNLTWEIGGYEFLGYFAQRWLANSANYVGTFHADGLIERVLSDCQGVTNGSMGLIVPDPSGATGTNISGVNYQYNQFQMAHSVITDITSTQLVEVYTHATYSAGNTFPPIPKVVVGVPICGVPVSTSGFAVDIESCVQPGPRWPHDGTGQANDIVEMGMAATGVGQTTAVANDTGASADGYPLLQKVVSRAYVLSSNALNSVANADLDRYHHPVVSPTLPFFSDTLTLGLFGLGDEVRCLCPVGPMFPSALDQMMRIVSYETIVPDNADSAVTTLTLNHVPSNAPAGW